MGHSSIWTDVVWDSCEVYCGRTGGDLEKEQLVVVKIVSSSKDINSFGKQGKSHVGSGYRSGVLDLFPGPVVCRKVDPPYIFWIRYYTNSPSKYHIQELSHNSRRRIPRRKPRTTTGDIFPHIRLQTIPIKRAQIPASSIPTCYIQIPTIVLQSSQYGVLRNFPSSWHRFPIQSLQIESKWHLQVYLIGIAQYILAAVYAEIVNGIVPEGSVGVVLQGVERVEGEEITPRVCGSVVGPEIGEGAVGTYASVHVNQVRIGGVQEKAGV